MPRHARRRGAAAAAACHSCAAAAGRAGAQWRAGPRLAQRCGLCPLRHGRARAALCAARGAVARRPAAVQWERAAGRPLGLFVRGRPCGRGGGAAAGQRCSHGARLAAPAAPHGAVRERAAQPLRAHASQRRQLRRHGCPGQPQPHAARGRCAAPCGRHHGGLGARAAVRVRGGGARPRVAALRRGRRGGGARGCHVARKPAAAAAPAPRA